MLIIVFGAALTTLYYDRLSIYENSVRYAELVSDNPIVKRVVINNCAHAIEIYNLEPQGEAQRNWKSMISIYNEDLDKLVLADSVLTINNMGDNHCLATWFLKVADDVVVEVNNSPNVKWLTQEQFESNWSKKTNFFDF